MTPEAASRRYAHELRNLTWALAAITAVLGAGLGAYLLFWTETQPHSQIDPDADRVDLDHLAFQPDSLEITPGTTVAFVNTDTILHNVVIYTGTVVPGEEGEAAPYAVSPDLAPGEVYHHTFAAAGSYTLFCTVGQHHRMGMVGHVTVAEP